MAELPPLGVNNRLVRDRYDWQALKLVQLCGSNKYNENIREVLPTLK